MFEVSIKCNGCHRTVDRPLYIAIVAVMSAKHYQGVEFRTLVLTAQSRTKWLYTSFCNYYCTLIYFSNYDCFLPLWKNPTRLETQLDFLTALLILTESQALIHPCLYLTVKKTYNTTYILYIIQTKNLSSNLFYSD